MKNSRKQGNFCAKRDTVIVQNANKLRPTELSQFDYKNGRLTYRRLTNRILEPLTKHNQIINARAMRRMYSSLGLVLIADV